MAEKQQSVRMTTGGRMRRLHDSRFSQRRLRTWTIVGMFAICSGVSCPFAAIAAEETNVKQAPVTSAVEQALSSPHGLVRLSKEQEIWIDPKRKLVVVDGVVALREGPLEMFACSKGTKEHESVVAVNCSAQLVHTGLLAVGAVPGHAVQFEPSYVPASGTEIEIWVLWTDAAGKRQKVHAQDWVRELRTQKEMAHPWVFAGSGFWTDESTGARYYYGDSGDLICVSNFPSATLDLPIKSSQANDELAFVAFTDRIPPSGTKVRLVLIPKPDDRKVEKPKQVPTGKEKAS